MTIRYNQVSDTIPVDAFFEGDNVDVSEIIDGLVHQTYLVKVDTQLFILQRINTYVFKEADKVISNIQVVTAHLQQDPSFHLQVPILKHSVKGDLAFEATDGGLWRCFYYIEGHTRESLTHIREAYEVAQAFGQFSASLSSLPPDKLHYTIMGFHDPVFRQSQFSDAVHEGIPERLLECQDEIRKIEDFSYIAREMANLDIPLKVAHNDPKLSNVLFNEEGHPVSVIDLDTVMPGSPLHDFGDLVRSMAASVPEDFENTEEVFLNLSIYKAIEEGFRDGAGDTLTKQESRHLKLGAAYIIWEQAMRFLSDYLVGDIYYRIKKPGHNLIRARNQITLLQSFYSLVYEK